MTIGIDISQMVYEGTGVAKYVKMLVTELVKLDTTNSFVIFGASFRKRHILRQFAEELKKTHTNVKSIILPVPPRIMEFVWNRIHIIPISLITGRLDVFWSSDWTQPPLGKTLGITTIHDLSVLLYPESFNSRIVSVQKRRLYWAKRECRHYLCDSVATKKDVERLLNIDGEKLSVIYPGFSPLS